MVFMQAVVQLYANDFSVTQQFSRQFCRQGQAVCIRHFLAIDIEVPENGHGTVGVCHDHRDGVVFIDDLQHQVQVGALIGSVQRAHCLGPDLHFVAFFFREVADQKM